MKEREIGPSRLTNRTLDHRLVREGVPPMPEESIGEIRLTPEPQKPKAESSFAAQTDKIKAWEQKSGISWDKTPLELRSAWLTKGETRQEQPQEQMQTGPTPTIDLSNSDNYTNSGLKIVVNRIANYTGRNPDFIKKRADDVDRLISSGTLSPEDLAISEQLLVSLENEENSLNQVLRAQYRENTFGMYLQPEDIEVLREDPIKWLDSQFNILYRSVQEGQELSSPVVNNLQTVVSEAIRYLQYQDNPERLDRFQTLFIVRFNLMAMRTTIGYRSIDSIKESAMRLSAHGLMTGFAMEDGKVTSMFNRLNEVLDDERLRTPTNHVTPEMANRLQENIIQEQLQLAGLGISQFGDLSPQALREMSQDQINAERERVRDDIVRAVRIGYDVFVNSQRQAIIVARGKHLIGPEGYFSDPSSGPLNVYNLEDLLTEKFDIFNFHDYEKLERIKLDMADSYIKDQRKKGNPNFEMTHKERVDLGTRLFRDLFAVPDFFSSGWRVNGILDSMKERMQAYHGESEGEERAKEMGLFLRLKAAHGDTDRKLKAAREEVWEKIAEFRPDEIVRLFRERAKGDTVLEDKLSNLFRNQIFIDKGIENYDQFKEKYGSILRRVRENGFDEFRQINIADNGLTQEEKDMVNTFIGSDNAAVDLQAMFTLMSRFSDSSIEDLLTNNKFEDIYSRTINVDDAMLNELEKTELELETQDGEKIKISGFIPLSRKWAADQGGDALIRNWNDTGNAVKAAHALVQFIKAEKIEESAKHSVEFAEAASQYNGQEGRAKCVRYTFGTLLNISKKDYIWDVIGLEKLPARLPMSDIERIYGPSAQPLGRDEIRHQIDEVSTLLVANLSKKVREGLATPQEEEEELKKIKRFERDLEELTEVTTGQLGKLKIFSLLLYLILATTAEGYKTSTSALKDVK